MPDSIKAVTFFRLQSYRNSFPQIPALAEANYFLQFNAYEVFLPQRIQPQEALNIFELTVLKFLALGNFSVEDLAAKLCIKPDFIKFILARLIELELLDKNRAIIDAGREFLGEKVDACNQNIVPYLLLMARDTADIFPTFFPRDNLLDAQLNKPFVELTLGSTGKARILKGRPVFVKEQFRHPATLPQDKIRAALQVFNRNNPNKIFVESGLHIQSTYTQPVFLHVKAVLQDGFVNHLVASDGLQSHSDFLRLYLERNNPKVLTALKDSATKLFEQQRANPAPDNAKYPEIRKLTDWKDSNAANFDQAEQADDIANQLVENLAKAVEWALLYHLKKFPPPQQLIRTLSLQSPDENFRTLTDLAARAGFNDSLKFPGFFANISANDVKSCLSTDNPTLVPLLAINIASSARLADSNFFDAVKVLPEDDAFGFLKRLDTYGKSLRHQKKWSPLKGDTPTFLRENVLNFIQALLPDYQNSAKVAADLSNASQQKINAQVAIIRLLGEETFQNLSPDLQALTLKISPDKVANQMPLPIEFVTTLSVILETLLRRRLQALPEKISVPKAEVIERLKRAGLSTDLRTVGENFYSAACNGAPATLGAYALAYMASLDDAQFQRFTANALHDLCFEVTSYRGHGNNLALVIADDKLAELRDRTFQAIKFLGG